MANDGQQAAIPYRNKRQENLAVSCTYIIQDYECYPWKKNLLTLRFSKHNGKEYSFILLSGFICGQWPPNTLWILCFFNYTWYPLVICRLCSTSTNIASAYQYIGYSKWLWSWKSMNFLRTLAKSNEKEYLFILLAIHFICVIHFIC